MKKALRALLALLVLASISSSVFAQQAIDINDIDCPTCGRSYNSCPYHFNHPKCSTCGKVIDQCQYKGKHPKCSTCGKVIDKCQYKGKHPKCSTCGKVVDQCPYKGKHPAKCSTCGKTVDKCQYKGKHPKCSTCGRVIDNCPYRGSHPTCSTCGRPLDNCPYNGTHPKCKTCGKTIDDCQYKGKHPATAKCKTCGKTVDKCQYKGKHPTEQKKSTVNDGPVARLQASMVLVRGGTFKMGATSEQGRDADNDEWPAHQVTVKDFYICKYEVTQELWQAVMGNNPSHFKGDLKRPVENVSWQDCQVFITKLNKMTGKNYRLPTEAEWEFAARGGNQDKGYKFSGSNNLNEVAWSETNSQRTSPVATKKPNELGLFDMSGNVFEWCQDWSGPFSSGAQSNPMGPTRGTKRIIRGGCWVNMKVNCRVSKRHAAKPSVANCYIGLRLVSSSL